MSNHSNSDEKAVGETGEEVIRSLANKDIEYLFANFGTDHPPLIKALASVEEEHNIDVIISPHEMVAASAAHGYAQVTGDPQVVLVHVDVGTANLGASIHNASRCRVPIMLLAGRSPLTSRGELPGTRNLYVHYYQDVYDQHSLVKEYTKWEYELKINANADGVIARGLDVAQSHPEGPVYLTMPREVLRSETNITPSAERTAIKADRRSHTALDPDTRDVLVELLDEAEYPILITTYFGRDESAVPTLVNFAESFGVGVTEAYPVFDMNFPRHHNLHLGFEAWDYFNEADLIFIANCDVPWIPSQQMPREDTTIVHVDVDTTKSHLPYWDFPADFRIEADPKAVFFQLTEAFDGDGAAVEERTQRLVRNHDAWQSEIDKKVPEPDEIDDITPTFLSSTVGDVIEDDDIVVDETVTNTVSVLRYVQRPNPGTYYAPCSSGLGWGTGAALGIKLAKSDERVVSLLGDGAFVFGNPFASIQMAQAYDLPHVNVIYNNSGWEAVNLSVEGQYGSDSGFDYERFAEFDPAIRFAGAAAELGCYSEHVSEPTELANALERCLKAVENGTHAILDVTVFQEDGY